MGKRTAAVALGEQAAREAARAKIGRLSDSRVQPRTLQRYHAASSAFIAWCALARRPTALTWDDLDAQLCAFVEHLWSTGHTRNQAGDVLSSVSHFLHVRKRFCGAWQLLKAWQTQELPVRAPPMPELVLLGLASAAIQIERLDLGVVLLLGFRGLLRTMEMLTLRGNTVAIDERTGCVVISLPLTKTSRRHGAQELVVVDCPVAVRWTRMRLQQLTSPGEQLCSVTPPAFRVAFRHLCDVLGVAHLQLRPYSLRRGGATELFRRSGSMDTVLERGRWRCANTARIYLNDGLARLSQARLSETDERTLVELARFLGSGMCSSLNPGVGRPPAASNKRGKRGR